MQIFKGTERETAGFKIRVLGCLTGEKKPGSFTWKSWKIENFKTTITTKRKEKDETKQEMSSHTQIIKVDLSVLSSSEEI